MGRLSRRASPTAAIERIQRPRCHRANEDWRHSSDAEIALFDLYLSHQTRAKCHKVTERSAARRNRRRCGRAVCLNRLRRSSDVRSTLCRNVWACFLYQVSTLSSIKLLRKRRPFVAWIRLCRSRLILSVVCGRGAVSHLPQPQCRRFPHALSFSTSKPACFLCCEAASARSCSA